MHAWPRVTIARVVCNAPDAPRLQRHLDARPRRVRLVDDRAEVLAGHEPGAPVLAERREDDGVLKIHEFLAGTRPLPLTEWEVGALRHAGAGFGRPRGGIEAISFGVVRGEPGASERARAGTIGFARLRPPLQAAVIAVGYVSMETIV